MRSLLICLAALLGVALSNSVAALADTAAAPASTGTAAAQPPAGAQTAPSCADPIQPKAAVENPKVSIVRDPKDGHQQRRVPHRQVHPGLTRRRCAGNLSPTSRVSTPMSSTSFVPIGSNRNVALQWRRLRFRTLQRSPRAG
jgi:hypothetical protein